MNNLNLNHLGMVEMNSEELRSTNGGIILGSRGWNLLSIVESLVDFWEGMNSVKCECPK